MVIQDPLASGSTINPDSNQLESQGSHELPPYSTIQLDTTSGMFLDTFTRLSQVKEQPDLRKMLLDINNYIDHMEFCNMFPCKDCCVGIFVMANASSNLSLDLLAVADGIAEDTKFCSMFGKLWMKLTEDAERFKTEMTWAATSNFMLAAWCFANNSLKFCEKLHDEGSIGLVIEWMISQEKSMGNPFVSALMYEALNLIYNCCRKVKGIGPQCRGIVDILQEFAKLDNVLVQTVAFLALSYIVDTNDAHKLSANDGCLDTLLGLLKNSLASTRHQALACGEHGVTSFESLEIVQGLEHLAINDNNKKLIAEKGGISIVGQLLKEDCSLEEQTHAAMTLWQLAFLPENAQEIKFQRNLIDGKFLKRLDFPSTYLENCVNILQLYITFQYKDTPVLRMTDSALACNYS